MRLIIPAVLFYTLHIIEPVYATTDSLRDKIGQMLIIGFDGQQVNVHSDIVNSIEKNNIGGVVLFDYNQNTKDFDKNIGNPTQVRQLNNDLQQTNAMAQFNHNRTPLPLIISIDYEGGKVNRLKPDHGFPETLPAAAIGKMDMIHATEAAEGMATTLYTAGFNLNFAPVVDVNVNPESPAIGKRDRSFSANSNEVARYASIYSNTYLSHHIQCTYKHFPGHGSATGDSHHGFVDITDTWQPTELVPYEQLIGNSQSCGVIMTAHLINRQLDKSGLPATLSHKILTDVLRKQLKFNGVIITDDMQMKAISENYSLKEAVTLAINAGADILLFANQLVDESQDPEALISLIETQVKAKAINKSRIDEAYQHIIALKSTL